MNGSLDDVSMVTLILAFVCLIAGVVIHYWMPVKIRHAKNGNVIMCKNALILRPRLSGENCNQKN